MIEIWRDIKDYEGLYQVSNLGRVRSVDRYVNNKGVNVLLKSQIIQPAFDEKGYLIVCLSNNNIQKMCKVHRLVAMTFPDLVGWTEEAKGKPFDKIVINHKDEHKDNNCVDNLEWCDKQYNSEYSLSKPILQYTKDMVFVAEYKGICQAARATGINVGNIGAVLKGKRKTAGGYIWKYK